MKPLTSRPHTIWVEDELWIAASNRGQVKDVVDAALRSYLTPKTIKEAAKPAVKEDDPLAAERKNLKERPSPWEQKYGKK